jgi:RND superfamily putative drug exporter
LQRARAFFGGKLSAEDAVGQTMDTAGTAVLFSGLTVLISLSAVLLVPSPAFRSMALGIMLSVVFILAATLTLLPAVLATLGPRVDKLSLPWVHSGEHRSPRFAAWGERLWRRPIAFGALAVVILVALAIPLLGLKTGMPSIKVVPQNDGSRVGYARVQDAFGKGAPGALQVVAPKADTEQVTSVAKADAGVAQVMAPLPGHGGDTLVQVVPKDDPSDKAVGATIDRLRSALPEGALVGGSVAENHDLEAALAAKTPLVIGVVLALGFLLLLVALQAPIVAAVGVVTNLLAVGPRSAPPGSSSRKATSRVSSDWSRRGSSTRGRPCSSSRWSSPSRWTTRSSCSRPPGSTGTAPTTHAKRWSAASRTPAASCSPPRRSWSPCS